jgi:hypothetical protein
VVSGFSFQPLRALVSSGGKWFPRTLSAFESGMAHSFYQDPEILFCFIQINKENVITASI